MNVYKYDKDVDDFINGLLDRMTPVVYLDEYHAIFKLKNTYIGVWTANKWFGFASMVFIMKKVEYPDNIRPAFYMSQKNLYDKRRPKKRTQLRLARFLDSYSGSSSSPLAELNKYLTSEVNV